MANSSNTSLTSWAYRPARFRLGAKAATCTAMRSARSNTLLRPAHNNRGLLLRSRQGSHRRLEGLRGPLLKVNQVVEQGHEVVAREVELELARRQHEQGADSIPRPALDWQESATSSNSPFSSVGPSSSAASEPENPSNEP